MLRYAITNGLAGDDAAQERLLRRAAALAQSGVDLILIREKTLEAGRLTALSRGVVAEVRSTGAATRVLIAGRADVALAAKADGVHLASGVGELRVGEVRQVFPEAFVSLSCHSLDEVRRAREGGASAVLFAPVFGKQVGGVEVVAPAGLQTLQEACVAAGQMPVFAMGGITVANVEQCMRAGAAGVAGIRMFFGT